MQFKVFFYKARQRVRACVHVAEFKMAAPYGSEKYWLRLRWVLHCQVNAFTHHSSEILANTDTSLN